MSLFVLAELKQAHEIRNDEMNLKDIRTAHFKATLRSALQAGYPHSADIRYGEVLGVCTTRASCLWRDQIVPEFGTDKVPEFKKALWRVRMRAEASIPWPMAYGYVFGAACHAIGQGSATEREAAATNSALAMFLIGLFDHILDKYPRELGSLNQLVSTDAIREYALNRQLGGLMQSQEPTLASGFADLYRIYFQRCHRLLGPEPDSPMARRWHSALARMHAAESASLVMKISKVPPSPALIEESEAPGNYSSWVVGLSACLGLDESVIRDVESFANDVTRLTRLVDCVVDVADDIQQDQWGGLAARLALGAVDQESADRIVSDVANECTLLLRKLAAGPASKLVWAENDSFTLMDVIWCYVWCWAGGETPGWRGAATV